MGDYDSLKEQRDKLRKEVNDLTKEVRELRGLLKNAEGEKIECIKRIKELEQELTDKDLRIQLLERENDQLERDLESFKIKAEKFEMQVDKLEKEKQALEAEHMELHKKLTKIEGEYELTCDKRDDLQKLLDTTLARYKTLEDSYKRSQERENKLQTETLTAHKKV